jgi:hypothetical protein
MPKLKQGLDLPGRPDAEEPDMTEHELAARERVTVRTVREWRQKGTGPKFRKLGPGRGALVRYRWVDYLAWREETVTSSTAPRMRRRDLK